MFPPEFGSGPRDTRDTGLVRRVGRRGRPLSLVLAVALLAVFWIGSASAALWGVAHDRAHGRAGAVGGVVFWTLVVALLLWRVWRGGRGATAFMARVGTAIGGLMLAGMVAFVVLMAVTPPGGSALTSVFYLLPGVFSGAALLAAGILLRRREVRQWGGY